MATMMSRSLFRLTLLCVVFLLFLSVGSVVGKKAASSQDVDSLGGSYSNTLSEATPTLTPEQIATAAKALQRKRDLLKKRRSKSESAYAQAQRSAKQRASQLAQRRAAKATKEAKAKEAAKQRADALAAKKRQADTPEIRRKGHDKLKWLLRKSAESGSRMISLDLQSFNQYVGDGPRPYHLMIAFTALTAQYNCYYCHLADDAIRPVAIAHYERSKERVAAVLASNSTADIPDSELPVFFANVDIARNRELFSELKLSQTPYLILAPPRLGTKALKPVEFMKQLPQKYRFNLQANMAPSDFSSFINKLAGIHVNIDAVKPGFTDLLFMLVVLFGIAFVGFRYGYDILMKLREIEGIRFLVLIGGFGLYCWCISGGMYNVIRNVQWAETHKDGSTNYINGDARDQYAAEGLLIGVLNLACAFVLISMNLRSFDYGATTQTGKGAKLSPLQHLKNAIAPFFSPIVCLVLLIAFWHSVLDIYTRKNWGYRRGFVWR